MSDQYPPLDPNALDFQAILNARATGQNTEGVNSFDHDLRTLSPVELERKHGARGLQAMSQLLATSNQNIAEAALISGRTDGEVLYDTGTGLGSGFVGGLANIGALGIGLVNEDAGVWASDKISEGMDWLAGTQSPGLNAARQRLQRENAADARANAAKMQQEIDDGSSELVAGLRRFGRDFVDSVSNMASDPTTMVQGTSEAIGSMLAGGPVAKGLRALGAPVANALRASGPLTRNADRVIRAGSASAWPGAIAALESGGVYTGTTSDIMSMSFEQLMQTSPTFRELVAAGVSPEEARIQVASQAGLLAAAIQAPVAAAAGTLTRFAETPFRAPSAASAIRNTLINEPLEEAVQSTTGGLSQGYATKRYADDTLELTEGLGEQTAQGALYGLTSAGTLQAPGAVVQGSKAAVKRAVQGGKAVTAANRERAREILQRDVDASNIGSAAVEQAANEVMTSIPAVAPAVMAAVDATDATPEQKQEIRDYVSKVSSALAYDPVAFMEQTEASPEIVAGLGDASNRVQAVIKAASNLSAAKDYVELATWGGVLHNLMEPLRDVAAADLEAMDSLPKEHVDSLKTYQNVLAAIEASDKVQAGLKVFQEAVAQHEKQATDVPDIATPEGKAHVNATVAAASLDPVSVSERSVNTVLDHANAGRIQLTPESRRALNISKSLLAAIREQDEKAQKAGLKPHDPIRENVLTGNDPAYGDQQSANQHIREIRQAIRGGNTALARGGLDVFGEFVKHMGRKIDALNEHYATFGQKGRPSYVPYIAYNPSTGELFPSDSNAQAKHKGMFVEPTNLDSVKQAQTLALEYETLIKIFNGLTDALPELRVRKLQPTSLNPALQEDASEIVKQHQLKKAAATKIKQAPAKQTEPKEQQKAKPAPVVAEAEAPTEEVEPKVEDVTPSPVLAMQPDNIAKIKAGTKTATSRTKALEQGDYVLSDGTPVTVTGGLVANISKLRDPEAWAKAEGFESLADFRKNAKYQHTKDFLDGKRGLYIYQLTTTKTAEAPIEEADPVELVVEIPTEAPAEAIPEPEIEEAPGAFTLTDGQVKALEMARDFMADKSETAFSIIGAAGTGKTTIVNQLLEDIPPNTPITLASPTHRANAVTQSKAKNDYPIRTLHSLLGLKPSMNLEKFDASKPQFEFGKEPDIESGSLIVMDESSMIPDKLFKFLMSEVKRANAKIIFLGDGSQLAPVGQKELSAAIADPKIKRAELTEVKRAKNSALLGESVYVRENGTFTNTPTMKKRNGVAFTNSRDAFLDQAVKLFQSDAFKDNPLLGRVLAFTNKKVQGYNAAIRQALYPEGGELVVGELLMGYNTVGKDGEGRASVSNGVDYIVTEVGAQKNIEIFGGVKLPGYSVKLRNVYDGRITTVQMISPNTPRALLNELSEALGPIANHAWRAGSYEAKLMDDLRDKFVFPFDVTYENTKFGTTTAIPKAIDYGYAHTIHKSQGGTYTYAMVDNIDIGVARTEDERARLRYVGLTRAERGTYVLTTDKINSPSNAEVVSLVTEAKPAAAPKTPAQAAVEAPVEAEAPAEAVVETPAEPAAVETSETEATTEGRKNPVTRAARAYPKLISHVRNWFTRLYDIPKTPMTRIWDYESPSEALYDALAYGEESIEEFGVRLRHPITERAIESFSDLFRSSPKAQAAAASLVKSGKPITPDQFRALTNVKGIGQIMQQNLQVALKKGYGKKVPGQERRTLAEHLNDGVEVNRVLAFKGLNIAQRTENGGYVYNPTLLEGAVLAGLNWALTMGRTVQERDAEQIAKITGIPEDAQGNAADSLMQGFTATEMANALVPMIKRYWNVRDPRNDDNAYADPAYLDGIPTAVAMEVLRAMEQVGFLVRHEAVIPDPESEQNRVFYVFSTNIQDEGLYDYPELIEELVSIKPEQHIYLGDERPPVPDTKLNTEGVENTKQDKAAIKAANNTPYRLISENYEMFQHLDEDGFKTLFGGGIEDEKTMNVMHLKSVRGRNANILSGWRTVRSLGQRLQRIAEDGNVDDVSIHYAHNMSSVNRMQQLGGMTPQGNKLVREIILPTKAKVDMGKPRTRQLFDLAVAQGLEIKIHKMPPAQASSELANLLGGTLAPAVDAMTKWLKNKDTPLDHEAVANALRASGLEVTPLAFHVLKEHARFQLADTAARASFETTVYIEADGVTNGVVMAQLLMGLGEFTVDQVRSLMMGGISFGPKQTMADLHVRNGGKDNYTVAAEKGEQALVGQIQQIAKQKNSEKVMNLQIGILDLISKFLPGVSLTLHTGGKVDLKLDRSITKNPMTVTLYGSSASGIANKITTLLLDEIYARVSEGPLSPEERDLIQQALTQSLVYNKKKRNFFVADSKVKPAQMGNLVNFQLDSAQFRQLQSNILTGLVNPLRTGIEMTLGATMMESTTRIRKAMQVQSILFEQMYRKRIEEALKYREENDPSYKKGDYLSRTDLAKIRDELKNVAPWFKTATQTMLINKFSFLRNGYSYGRSLDDGEKGFRPFAQVLSPINSGVAAIPYLNIGLGDAGTIQSTYAANEPEFGRSLPVFDGVNLSLNDIDKASERLNKGVVEAGMTNPHLAVMTSFNKFLADPKVYPFIDELLSDMESPEAKKFINDISFALGIDKDDLVSEDGEKASISAAVFKEHFDHVAKQLRTATISVEARHRVMRSVSMSVDQFAAVGQPHQTEGDLLSGDLTPEEVAIELKNRYYSEIGKIGEELKAVSKPLPGAVEDPGTGARIYNKTAILELAKGAVLSQIQSDTLAAIMPGLTDYSVIAGTPEQINTTLSDIGQPQVEFIRPDGAVRNGVIDIDNKRIYLVNQDPEVLVHELVHAATFDTLLRYYNGEKLSPQATAAVARLELLLEQFEGMRVTRAMTPEQIEAMNNAKLEIDKARNHTGRSDATNKAAALNEFMAWATTNNALATRLTKIRANPLARFVGEVIDAIKSLLKLPKSDMLSNVVFNAGILANERPTLSNMITGVTMDHATAGAPEELTELRKRLTRKIFAHLDTLPEGDMLKGMLPFWQPMVMGQAVSKDFQNVFGLTEAQASTLELVVASLATNMELDAPALAQAQVLYQHVLKNLSVESFMDPDAADVESERYYAQQKFNLVTGKTGRVMDKNERSSLMATFLGMGLVSPEFQSVMAKMPPLKTEGAKDGKFNSRVAAAAESGLDNLGKLVSGQGRAQSVNASLTALAQRVFSSVSEERSMIKSAGSTAYEYIDRANDYVVSALGKLSDWGTKKGMALTDKGGTAAARAAGAALAMAAGTLTTESAEAQSEVAISWANKLKTPPTLTRLMTDLIGRTGSNANLYDRIKLMRSSIQQVRQHFRTDVPAELARSFKKTVTRDEWTAMTALAKTDMSILHTLGNKGYVGRLVSSKATRASAIKDLELSIQQMNPNHFSLYQQKAKQLADYMNGKGAGANLLTNAHAISMLLNIPKRSGWSTPSKSLVQQLDQLISLYALDGQSDRTLETLARLFKDESEGMNVVMAYMAENRADEMKRVGDSNAKYNYVKGHTIPHAEAGKSLRVVDNKEGLAMRQLGYTNLGPYRGSQLDSYSSNKSYFYSELPSKAAVAQGIMQNIHRTAGGVDPVTGYRIGPTAGRIVSRAAVANITGRINNDKGGMESLIPVFDNKGKVIAYERAIDPRMLNKLSPPSQLHEILGMWRGRQVEEMLARDGNIETIKVIDKMHKDTVKSDPSRQKEFVNLMDTSSLDPVIKDMVSLFSYETREYIKENLDGQLWVRRDMLEDVTGYRQPSSSDFWTGVSRWSPATQQMVRDLTTNIFGIKAYQRLQVLEQVVQGLASDARTLIVVKSGLIPMLNFMSNIYHLLASGVPINVIVKEIPRKLVELRSYNRGMTRKIQLEVQIRASRDNPARLARLRAEMRSINDSFSRMSIAPLINAGEFSTVADVGDQREDLQLSSGRVGQWLDNQIDKLPAHLQTVAKTALVSKDTALFQGLQKSVQYGDFLAKAVLFDYHTKRKGMTPEQSLGIITDEFVNYDRLPGRVRGGLENFGLAWFFNFKLRMVKVAASTLRNRPVYALLTSQLPVVPGAEMPIGDTIISKVAEGTLGHSIGPGMGFSAPSLNPWWNLVN